MHRGRRRRRDFKARNTTDLYKNSPGSVRHRRTPATRKESSQAAGVGIGILLDHLGHTSEDIRWLSMRCHSRALGMHAHAHARTIWEKQYRCPKPQTTHSPLNLWLIFISHESLLDFFNMSLRNCVSGDIFISSAACCSPPLCGVFWAVTKRWLKKTQTIKCLNYEARIRIYHTKKKWRPESLQKAKVWMHPLEGAL